MAEFFIFCISVIVAGVVCVYLAWEIKGVKRG